jgi:hypothetical protein
MVRVDLLQKKCRRTKSTEAAFSTPAFAAAMALLSLQQGFKPLIPQLYIVSF